LATTKDKSEHQLSPLRYSTKGEEIMDPFLSTFSVLDEQDQFSTDLIECAKLHIHFLKSLHLRGISIKRPSKESFRRYDELWLPLLLSLSKRDECNNNSNSPSIKKIQQLVPPADVAWIWHCHRLAPCRYIDYINSKNTSNTEQENDDFMLEASPPFSCQFEDKDENEFSEICRTTRDVWNHHYPNEPFFLNEDCNFEDVNENKNENESINLSNLGGFDIVGSCERQSTFLWQVSGLRFSDDDFLVEGVRNYYKFLCLKSTDAGKRQIIVPTYQIDLMWHTHILSSLSGYNADYRQITGSSSMLHHDDSLNDRTEGGTLDVAFHKTKKLWQSTYQKTYEVKGGMFRGEPPNIYFSPEWITLSDNDTSKSLPSDHFSHLIGKVGASSTGVPEKEFELPTMMELPEATKDLQWLTPSLTNESDVPIPPFIAPNAKSKVRGQNTNPVKEDYVFGNGSVGVGYYHMLTKDAYDILAIRLVNRNARKEQVLSNYSCYICCCPCISSLRTSKEKLETEIQHLNDMIDMIRARRNAPRPVGDELDLPKEVSERIDKYNKENKKHQGVHKTTVSSNPYYDYGVPYYFVDAAACGAGSPTDGGGCGG
jgi:hypothetical protein